MSDPTPLDPQALILSLVNGLNQATLPVALSPSNVTIDTPTSWSPGDGSAYNTTLTLTAVDGQGYADHSSIYYARVDLGQRFSHASIVPVIDYAELHTWDDVIAALNAQYNANLSSLDRPQVPLVLDPPPATIAFVVPPTSLLYVGALTIQINLVAVTLSSAITELTMDGLTAPFRSTPALDTVITQTHLDGLTGPEVVIPSLVDEITVTALDGLHGPLALSQMVTQPMVVGLTLSQLNPSP